MRQVTCLSARTHAFKYDQSVMVLIGVLVCGINISISISILVIVIVVVIINRVDIKFT